MQYWKYTTIWHNFRHQTFWFGGIQKITHFVRLNSLLPRKYIGHFDDTKFGWILRMKSFISLTGILFKNVFRFPAISEANGLVTSCNKCLHITVMSLWARWRLKPPACLLNSLFRQRKHQSSRSLGFVRGIYRWPVYFPAQRASNTENVSIWWRYYDVLILITLMWWGCDGLSFLYHFIYGCILKTSPRDLPGKFPHWLVWFFGHQIVSLLVLLSIV